MSALQRWLRFAPLVAAIGVAAIPIGQYVRKAQAESAGEDFLRRLAQAQLEFRRRHGSDFATTVESLTMPCPGEPTPLLAEGAIRRVGERGFVVTLRASAGAQQGAPDCHHQPTATDYYAALQPASADVAPRQAYAMTGLSGRTFVFVDGVAPLERDMEPGGLATPLERLSTFRIP